MQLRSQVRTKKVLAALPAVALVLSGAAAWAVTGADDPNPTIPSTPTVPGAPALPALPSAPGLPDLGAVVVAGKAQLRPLVRDRYAKYTYFDLRKILRAMSGDLVVCGCQRFVANFSQHRPIRPVGMVGSMA